MSLLLGIDLGTSYFKVGLFDRAGTLKGLGRVPVRKRTPLPGRAELPVDAFWRLLLRALGEALLQANAGPAEIVALSYSSQANTFVLLDRMAVPLSPLVFWIDSRGEPVEAAARSFSETVAFRQTIGWEGITGQSAVSKWRWFQQNEPAIWERTRWIMTISDYLTFALTGEHTGDASTAAFLGLYDLAGRCWWKDALEAFGVEAKKLSTPLRPGSLCGHTRPLAAKLLGLPVGIPCAAGGLDHHMAAIGAGIERFAEVSISTGTVLAALALVDAVTPQRGCYHGLHMDGRRYYRLAFDPAGAGQLEEYQRLFAADRSIAQLIALAASAPQGSKPEDRFAPADADAMRGIAVRCLLECMAFTHRKLVREMAGAAMIRKIVATGGGARSALWLQMKADIMGVPIVMPSCPECACLGAALLGAVAAGYYPSITEASVAMVRARATFEPTGAAVEDYRKRTG